jgi:hypothetical protein
MGVAPRDSLPLERLRNALVKALPAILDTVVKIAKAGDNGAAKTILERVLPPLTAAGASEIVDELAGTLTEQGVAILRTMADRDLAPGQVALSLRAIASSSTILT